MGKQAKAKARFYANQARDNKITQQQASNAIAGKGLNVSAPKTSTNSAYAGSPLFNPANYAGNEGMAGGTNSAYKGSPLFNPSNYAQNQSSSKSNSGSSKSNSTPNKITDSSPTSSNRSLAQTAFNKVTGTNTAVASSAPKQVSTGTISAPRQKGVFERGLEILKDPLGLEPRARALFNDMPWGSKIYQTENGATDSISQALEGVTPELGISEKYLGDNTGVFSPSENQPYQPVPRPQPVPIPYNSNDSYEKSRQDRGASDKSVTSPKQVTNPFVAPSPFVTPETPQIKPQVNIPDYTPAQTQQSGTQRQLLGNGILSNGIASNGGGNYGVQGAMTRIDNQDNNSTIDDLLTLLGVKPMTAQAAETQNYSQPQSSFNFAASPFGKATTSPSTMQGNAYAGSPLFNPANYAGATNTNPAPKVTPTGKNPGGSKAGGVAQQYAQPQESESIKLQKQQEKGYSAQEKAQKKALNELIDSIKKQYSSQIDATNKNYDTQQTQGQSDLEKAKQADLMQLSGLFNFSANQSPDSEQRLQYQQRAQDQANTNLTNFLAKLAAARGTDLASLQSSRDKDISGAKTNYQSQLADIASKRNATQLEIAKMIDDAKQKALDRAEKSKSSGTTLKLGQYGVVPDGKGGQRYVYLQGGQITDVTPAQYMAGKFGLGINGNSTPLNVADMSDEELQAIANGQ